MERFEWAVRSIYDRIRLVKPGQKPKLFYLVRWAPTNFNAPDHQNEFPLKLEARLNKFIIILLKKIYFRWEPEHVLRINAKNRLAKINSELEGIEILEMPFLPQYTYIWDQKIIKVNIIF